MLKNFLIQTIIILFVLSLISNLNAANDDKIFSQTKINFKSIINFKDIKTISTSIRPWVIGDLCLLPSAFPNEDIKKKIKGTLAIFANIEFISKIKCDIQMAKFDNTDEAKLAFLDTYGITTGLEKYSLLSGKKIDNAIVITYNVFKTSVLGYLIYKNCVCRLRFYKDNEINKSEKNFIDNFIIKMKDVIDQSFPHEM